MTAAVSDWRMSAACRDTDPDSFFPVASPGTDAYAEETAEALKACGTCTVRVPCRDYAVATSQEWGIWAATTPSDRSALRLNLTRGAA